LPTQYSSEDSSNDSDEDEDNQLLKEPPEMLAPGLALRNVILRVLIRMIVLR
jgi:hypothetical protein